MDREFGLLKIVVENLFGHEQSVMDSGDDSFQNKFKTNSINKISSPDFNASIRGSGGLAGWEPMQSAPADFSLINFPPIRTLNSLHCLLAAHDFHSLPSRK